MDNGTHWRDRLLQQGHGTREVGGSTSPPLPPIASAPPTPELPLEEELPLDMAEYKPWVLQRGRTRPAALLNLRWFDARAGMWLGCAMAYPQLIAAEYVGERMVSLDFGKRQFVLEGEQLGELRRQGTIVVVVTHDLEAIAGRTDHIAILRRGSLVFEERGDDYSYEALKDIYHRHAN